MQWHINFTLLETLAILGAQEKGWDLLEAEADSEAEMDTLIQVAGRKFWNIWLRDNTGKIAVVMYKPSGAAREWECRPGRTGYAAEVVWL